MHLKWQLSRSDACGVWPETQRTRTIIPLGQMHSRLLVCTHSSFRISSYTAFLSPLSLLSSFSFLHTQPHYGGSFMFDHDPCPICPLSHTDTHTHTLVVSSGPVRGCSVYCGADVQSCRLKSLTSLLPTGGLYTIFTGWSMLGQIIVCRHVAAGGSVRGWYQAMCPISSSVSVHWFVSEEVCLHCRSCSVLAVFPFSLCDFSLDLERLQTAPSST